MRALLLFAFLAAAFATPAAAQISKKDFPPAADLTPVSADDAVPITFRGEIQYRGFYRGQAFIPGPAPRELSVDAMLRSAAKTRTLPMGGDYVVRMEFDGSRVKGSVDITNTLRGDFASLDDDRFTGTRTGTTCRLTWSDGTEIVVYCGRSEFRVNFNSRTPQGQIFAYAARIPAAKTTDYAERDRLAALAEQQRQRDMAALAAADADARAKEARELAAAQPAGLAITLELEKAISLDSWSWIRNVFRIGTVRDVKVLRRDGARTVVRGSYTYNDTMTGWAEAIVVGGKVTCLRYWDMSTCDPVRRPPGVPDGKVAFEIYRENIRSYTWRVTRSSPGKMATFAAIGGRTSYGLLEVHELTLFYDKAGKLTGHYDSYRINCLTRVMYRVMGGPVEEDGYAKAMLFKEASQITVLDPKKYPGHANMLGMCSPLTGQVVADPFAYARGGR